MPVGVGVLHERGVELERISAAIEEVGRGHGRLVVIEGGPGLGKTRLLAAACDSTASRGLTVLRARGGEQERLVPFGVVRELFEGLVLGATEDDCAALFAGAASLAKPLFAETSSAATLPAEVPTDISFTVVRGLYWLTANLAERGPVMIAVDDVHWVDEASARFLGYLAPRVAQLPLLYCLTARPREFEQVAGLAAALAAVADVERIKPAPLSAHGSAALVREVFAPRQVEDIFCATVHRSTEGNPLLVRTLAVALQARRVDPTADSAAQIEVIGCDSIASIVLPRLHRLGEDAVELARAVAIWGPRAELRDAAAVAQLSIESAAEAADALAAAELIHPGRPLAFTHPLMRRVVTDELGEGRRAQLHRRAAHQRAQLGARPEDVAQHLLFVDAAADPRVCATLRDAAQGAGERGAPEAAVTYLERCLQEPPPNADHALVLLELGKAAFRAQLPRALEWLRAAVDAAREPQVRARAEFELISIKILMGQPYVLQPLLAALPEAEPDLTFEIEALLKGNRLFELKPHYPSDSFVDGPEPLGRTRPERFWLSAAALQAVMDNAPAERAVSLAERALASGTLMAETGESWPFGHALGALVFAGRTDLVLPQADRAVAHARQRGSVAFEWYLVIRAIVQLLGQGLVAQAERDAAESLQAGRQHGWLLGLPLKLAWLVSALRERGELAAAESVLAEHGLQSEPPPANLFGLWLLESRGELRLAAGKPREALSDLLRCGELLEVTGTPDSALSNWRADAALAWLAVGERDTARRLAVDHLEGSRAFGAAPRLGHALRVLGLVTGPGPEGIALLREAIEVLEATPARLQRAHAYGDLGALLRRASKRTEAREPLRKALDLAIRCGATALAERANQELHAAGARPRRTVLSGVDALTTMERRVAMLAVEGLSNPEIAQTLFVSRKTVETHLGRVFSKLGLSSRDDLPTALRS